jgi:hypothetical protein
VLFVSLFAHRNNPFSRLEVSLLDDDRLSQFLKWSLSSFIVNARIDAGFEVVLNQVEAIAARSFTTMNRVGTQAVLAQTYNVASRQGFSFHLSYVGRDLPDSGGTGFETAAMRRLYDYGYEKARSGAFWETKLPQIEVAKEAAKTAER